MKEKSNIQDKIIHVYCIRISLIIKNKHTNNEEDEEDGEAAVMLFLRRSFLGQVHCYTLGCSSYRCCKSSCWVDEFCTICAIYINKTTNEFIVLRVKIHLPVAEVFVLQDKIHFYHYEKTLWHTCREWKRIFTIMKNHCMTPAESESMNRPSLSWFSRGATCMEWPILDQW